MGRERLVGDSGGVTAKPMIAREGRPLDGSTRARMEASFGTDLSNVRVHTDEPAARSARAMGANAYALGNDIVFGAGRYAPGTVEGEGLIAHEVGHVVDQTQRGAPHQIMRQAGTDPLASWDALVTFDVAGPKDEVADRLARAKEAKRRLAKTTEGGILLNQLWSMFAKGHTTPTKKITVHFVDSVPARVPGDADGYFEETADGYEIWVEDVRSSSTIGGMWPSAKAPKSYYAAHTDPESAMAATLYHELLHVWFVNQYANAGRLYTTGHGGNVEKGEIDDEFFERLETFNTDLVNLEKELHAESAPSVPEPTLPTDLDDSYAPARRAASPRWIGGEATVGGMAGKGAGGIVGADVLLGKLHALDVGVRGVYLTPNHLFVGGSVGFRLRQGSGLLGGRVERPLFFNLEIGLLKELSPSETDRLTDKMAGFGSIGVGKEYGRSGARFVWQIGAFVLVSDKDDAAGHPNLAGGVTGRVGLVF